MRRPDAPPISDRALNRATLARQGLLARQPVTALEMLDRLIGMQGQVHNAPYVGLWSRLETFRIGDLESLLVDRKAVRAPLMRVTLHVATADDYLAIRPLLDTPAWRGFRTNHLKALGDAPVDDVLAASRALLEEAALAPVALGERLKQRWPAANVVALSMPARFLAPVVHVPPAGMWGATRPPELTGARRWLGREPGEPIELDALVLRYLTAFGPASGRDFNTWSGLAGGPATMERLRPGLVSFSGPDGRELFDLPDAPRPDEKVAAPVRLLPDYDNVILGYADRSRMLTPAAFAGLWRGNGLRPSFTVDGMVGGSWKLVPGKAAIAFSPFSPLAPKVRDALAEEGRALLGFAGQADPSIRFEAPE